MIAFKIVLAYFCLTEFMLIQDGGEDITLQALPIKVVLIDGQSRQKVSKLSK